MISKQLLDILVCPESRQPLQPAEQTLVDKCNNAIAEKRLKNRHGTVIERTMEAALVREDGKLLYPIIDGIPIMLVDEGIPLDQVQ